MDIEKFYNECGTDIAATAKKMVSPDYQDRMEAEYAQARIRLDTLRDMLKWWDLGELEYEPECPRSLLEAQLGILSAYVAILEEREKYESR